MFIPMDDLTCAVAIHFVHSGHDWRVTLVASCRPKVTGEGKNKMLAEDILQIGLVLVSHTMPLT